MTGRHKTQRRAWTEAETLQLQEFAGDMPFPLVMMRFNSWLGKQGLPHRSRQSLLKKLFELGTSRHSCGRWIGVGDLARMLGKHRGTVAKWCEAGLVRRYLNRNGSCVNRADLVKLARQRPQLFAGCERSALVQVLENQALADSIVEAYPKPLPAVGRGKRLLWVETGRVFSTYAEACQAAHVSLSGLRDALKAGKPVGGRTFRVLD